MFDKHFNLFQKYLFLPDFQIVYESANMSIENSHIYSRLHFREIMIWQLCNHDQGHSDKYKHKFHS